ncbi:MULTISPECIES: family 16 glycosylhydrolase [unclassified Polaribacter]|uniref:family 16 glycosylhydrolase n=1 Tax=unclassified Polaribacter TaxID=196858 RepID=UPI0011BE2D1A|nr:MULTISPECIES: family 16 glycosylhydrolase [unclassified Polaribacter]TXD52709.1 family 16 glycosylhydrolase [Polaribacter sp. IC063]TXD60677.1 family 16 glycosylhydrolase [Polaribacter sp. IC066]
MKVKALLFIIIIQCIFYSCSENSADSVDSVDKVEYIELNHSDLTINVGDKETLVVVKAPSTNETLVWSSDNELVATVFNGIVTAHQSGAATITAGLGNLKVDCKVTVPERTYQLVWSDEFDGTELNTDNWTYEVDGNGGGNNEKQYYTDRAENIRVENGVLTIEARKENYENREYTSARIITKDKQDFTYGKIEARLKVPSGRGTWPAFWMLGYGSWPRAGEIDIMEHVGYEPTKFHCALHTRNRNGLNGQNFHGSQDFTENVSNEFYTITMEWVEKEIFGFDRIHIYVDGVKTKTFGETSQLQESGDWPFNKDFFFILNLAIGGQWGGAEGIDDTMFDNKVLFEVDYIRVYQLN